MAKTDLSQWDAVFTGLQGPIKESLARRMLVEGGVLLRDVAKANAPVSDGPYNPSSRGSHHAGTYQDSLYLAKDTDNTTATNIFYKVTWNAKKAWWGKLIEFGYWRKYEVHRDNAGNFYTDKTKLLAVPVWVPPEAPLGRTARGQKGNAVRVMIERGKKELPILLSEIKQ
jgi:hypothetical protein